MVDERRRTRWRCLRSSVRDASRTDEGINFHPSTLVCHAALTPFELGIGGSIERIGRCENGARTLQRAPSALDVPWRDDGRQAS